MHLPNAWYATASNFGGVILQQKNPTPASYLEITQDSVTVTVRPPLVTEKARSTKETTIRAGLSLQALQGEILEESLRTRLGTFLGEDDIWLRDLAFDKGFAVRSTNRSLLQYLLTQEVRSQISSATGYRFSIAPGEVIARRKGLEDNAERLTSAVRAILAIASQERALFAGWGSLASLLGGSFISRPKPWDPKEHLFESPIHVLRQGISLTLDASHGEGTYRLPTSTKILVEAQFTCERFVCWQVSDPPSYLKGASAVARLGAKQAYFVFSELPEKTRARLSPEASALLTGEFWVGSYGRNLTLHFREPFPEEGAIQRAVQLAVLLTAQREEGPYR